MYSAASSCASHIYVETQQKNEDDEEIESHQEYLQGILREQQLENIRDQKQLKLMKKMQEGRNGTEMMGKNIFQYMNTAGKTLQQNKKLAEGKVRRRINRSISGNSNKPKIKLEENKSQKVIAQKAIISQSTAPTVPTQDSLRTKEKIQQKSSEPEIIVPQKLPLPRVFESKSIQTEDPCELLESEPKFTEQQANVDMIIEKAIGYFNQGIQQPQAVDPNQNQELIQEIEQLKSKLNKANNQCQQVIVQYETLRQKYFQAQTEIQKQQSCQKCLKKEREKNELQQQVAHFRRMYENEKREKINIEQAYKRQILKEMEDHSEFYQNGSGYSGSEMQEKSEIYQQATFSIDQNMTLKNNDPYYEQIPSRNGNPLIAKMHGAHFNTQDQREMQNKIERPKQGTKIIMTCGSIDNGRPRMMKNTGITTPVPQQVQRTQNHTPNQTLKVYNLAQTGKTTPFGDISQISKTTQGSPMRPFMQYQQFQQNYYQNFNQ